MPEPASPLPPRHEPSDWARHFLDAVAGQEVPEYRSPAWEALPVNDPRKVAACVAAAERYAALTDPAQVADRLAVELAAARAQAASEARQKQAQLADAVGWAASSRGRMEGVAVGALAELAAAARPGPDAFDPPTPVRNSPDWPPVVQPGQAGRAAAVAAAVQAGTRATYGTAPARQAARAR